MKRALSPFLVMFLNGRDNYDKEKGFTLLEVSIVLGIGTLIAFMKFQDMKKIRKRLWRKMLEHK